MSEPSTLRHVAVFAASALVTAGALSALFSVPYVYTAIGFASWIFVWHVVTIDEDFPGGWSNPDGSLPIPFV